MRLPEGLAQFNRSGTNRVMKPLARLSPGLAVVHHKGRRSGRSFTTPVLFFGYDGGFLIPLTYGKDRDWVKNVVAAGAMSATHVGREIKLKDPEVATDPKVLDRLSPPLARVLAGLNLEGFILADVDRS